MQGAFLPCRETKSDLLIMSFPPLRLCRRNGADPDFGGRGSLPRESIRLFLGYFPPFICPDLKPTRPTIGTGLLGFSIHFFSYPHVDIGVHVQIVSGILILLSISSTAKQLSPCGLAASVMVI